MTPGILQARSPSVDWCRLGMYSLVAVLAACTMGCQIRIPPEAMGAVFVWEDRFVIERELQLPNPDSQGRDNDFVASVMPWALLVRQSQPIHEFERQAEVTFAGDPGSTLLIWVISYPPTSQNEDVHTASVKRVLAVLESQRLPALLVPLGGRTQSTPPAEFPLDQGITPGGEGVSEEADEEGVFLSRRATGA